MKKYYRNKKQNRWLCLWEKHKMNVIFASVFVVFTVILGAYLSTRPAPEVPGRVVEISSPKNLRSVEYLEEIAGNREVLERTDAKFGITVDAAQLYISGRMIATLKNEKEANHVLDYFKKRYLNESSEILDVKFVENVEIRNVSLGLSDFDGYDSVEDTRRVIELGTSEIREHEVKSGENYWTIAQDYGITMEDLEAANPEVDPMYLLIGQKIRLVAPKTLLTVISSEKVAYSEEIDYEVLYEDSDNYFKGESRTKIAGSYGERAVEAKLVKQNGRVVSRVVLEEKVISEPINKVVYVGTKDPPPRMGTGVLGYPLAVYGYVSSEFGETWGRAFPHTGIDLVARTGTAILASDGGTVIASGWSGGYGYRVIIDHGGNIQTLYAHCSELLVSVGEQVFKGQTVAYSGNTGNSSGPHLHFEVRLNGVYQNPRYYLDF